MYIQDMALSFVYRIPMLRSTVQTVNLKYNQVKSGNTFAYIVLNLIELCFYLVAQLLSLVQTYDYKKNWAYVNNHVYTFVCQYATPVLWTQVMEIVKGSVHLIMEASSAVVRYVDHVIYGLRGLESPHTTVNFDSPNMNTFIDLITRSLAELRLKENNSLLELGGYENEFHQPGVVVEHSSTSCHCEKHNHDYINNNLESLPSHPAGNNDDSMSVSSGSADDNIIAESYKDTQDQIQQPEEQDHVQPEQTLSRQEWHKLCPTSQPLISMMTPANAFALAEALKQKRQDKTGRDAYEVDTVLVLLSQWDVIDEKSKHYAIDRANLLFLAICYGWSFALQKVSLNTTAPIVTPPVTNLAETEHPPLQRQQSNDGNFNPLKKLKRTFMSRSHGSVYNNDKGKHHPYHYNNDRFFQRPNGYQNYNRQSFPPNMYNRHQYNSGYLYPPPNPNK